MSAWKWTCSACGQEFHGWTKQEAEGKFLDHARTAHKPKILLSFDSTEGASD